MFSQGYCSDNVHVSAYEIDDHPGFSSLSRDEKFSLIQDWNPDERSHQQNTTTIRLFRYIVDTLDTNQSVDKAATHLAVGTDDTTPEKDNTSLNSEVARNAVTSTFDSGSQLQTSTFFDTSEANGNTIKEVGLFTAASGGDLLNHSTISDVVKTDTKVFTVDVSLTFDKAITGGNINMTTVSQINDYTANNEEIILADASGGPITVTLPDVSTDIFVFVKKTDSTSNAVTIATPNSETIDGHSNLTISKQYNGFTITSDSTNYFIV